MCGRNEVRERKREEGWKEKMKREREERDKGRKRGRERSGRNRIGEKGGRRQETKIRERDGEQATETDPP